MAGTPPDHPERRTSQRRLPIALAALVLILGGVLTFVLVGGEDEAAGQTVRFQTPTEPGPDPFTRPADVRGTKKVEVGSGPFGGTGSDLVCDRELLIKSLRARPDRLRAWAETLGVEPNAQAVARYIRRLRPVTLTRDTRVTNHSFSGGSVVTFQAILQAGTAVLVDKDGNPVARCRCGNPLADPVDYVTARCLACPADYKPPPPCSEWRDCYRRYPNPPVVITYRRRLHCFPPRSQAEFERCVESGRLGRDDVPAATTPQDGPDVPGVARFNPPAGTTENTYSLEVGDFDPDITLTITLTRPDGVSESYRLRTDEFGNGSFTFPRAANPPLGTYRATVSGGGESANATASVSGSSAAPAPEPEPEQPQQNPAGPEVGGGTDCNNPQSQDEIDLCGG